jgi:hypothetical protein
MKKTVKARSAGFLALAMACAGLVATTSAAQGQSPGQYRRDALTEASYDRMRQWARELDQVASYANRQAQADQAGYRGFRRDSNFLASIRNFARQANQFRVRMDSYRTRPWNVDDELDRLLRNARVVQTRIERARFVDASTRNDWNRVVRLLNQMLDEYRNPGRYDDGRYADDRYRRYPDGRYDRNGRYDDTYTSTDLRALARELDESASRMSQVAGRYGNRYGYSSEIRRFSDEARDFRNDVETRNFTRTELRARVNQLLEDAQDAYREISRAGADTRVADEWDRVVRALDRMRDLVV